MSWHMLHMLDTLDRVDTEDNQTVTQCHHGHADIADNQLVNFNLMLFWYLHIYTLHILLDNNHVLHCTFQIVLTV